MWCLLRLSLACALNWDCRSAPSCSPEPWALPSKEPFPAPFIHTWLLKALGDRDAFEKSVLADSTKYSMKAKYLPNIKAKFPFSKRLLKTSVRLPGFMNISPLPHPPHAKKGCLGPFQPSSPAVKSWTSIPCGPCSLATSLRILGARLCGHLLWIS